MKFVLEVLRMVTGAIAVALGGLFQTLTRSGAARPAPSSGTQRLKLVMACAVIFLASTWMFLKLRAPAVKVRLDGHEMIGQLAATETARLIGGKGGIVVLGPEDTHYDVQVEAQMKAFLQTLKQRKAPVLATERIKLTTQQKVAGLTPEMYFRLLEKYPSVSAIVSFFGVGQFTEDDLRNAPPRKPFLVSVSLSSFPSKRLFRADLVRLAIGPRFDRAGAGTMTKSHQEWFDRYFQTITPETARDLPR